MGSGQTFICSECGYEYDVCVGTGIFYTMIYNKITNDIKSGEYGETLKDIFLSDENITVDIGKCLYICNCDNWVTEPSLSLYSENRLIKKYRHICKKCGSEMTETATTDDLLLPCPKCGNINESDGIVRWD